MLTVGPIAFASAPILAALLLLPAIWWILRVSPPAPQLVRFPAIRLLFGLHQEEDTPARTPWWLLLLRLVLAALIILALAHPLLNPAGRLAGDGPVLLVVDDSWAAARHWDDRQVAIVEVLEQAERDGRPAMLLTTAAPPGGERVRPSDLLPADEIRTLAQALEPKPWPADREAALAAIENLNLESGTAVVWIADGIAGGPVVRLAERLQRFGSLRVLHDAAPEAPRLLHAPRRDGAGLTLSASRPYGDGTDVLSVRGTAADGRTVLRRRIEFADGQTTAEARAELPSEILNALVRLDVEDEASAGTAFLLDGAWRRRPVGIVQGSSFQAGHPLLDDLHYVTRALTPFSDVSRAGIRQLIDGNVAVIVLTDATPVTPEQRQALARWVERGGLLLRFAGPRLAEAADDDLLPIRIRRGGRALGGALSWSQPQQLAPFPPESPFAGLTPSPDVTVTRQLLAEPSIDLVQKTWASLTDGTPIVTAAPRGDGRLVLVHTTANADWSNLALSGLFLEMLERIVEQSQGVAAGGTEGTLPALELLDGFGRLAKPDRPVKPLSTAALAETPVGPANPPGYYGTENGRRAFNLSPAVEALAPLPPLPAGVFAQPFERTAELDLKPWVLLAAILLGLIDLIIALAMRGHLRSGFAAIARMRPRAVGALLFGALTLGAVVRVEPAFADSERDELIATEATTETRLAFVRTGVPALDETSRAGLEGLTWVLGQRTAIEPGSPIAVDVEVSELAFFPLLYWPVAVEHPPLSAAARVRVADYLRNGGTILFDTRDQGGVAGVFDLGNSAVTPERQKLREILRGINVPPLGPVPPDHVLTKAFYLMQEFPGRWTGGSVWVETAGSERNDGVSSVIIGGHDWAAAWAVDGRGLPLFPVVPGGETQREMAYRFGVNLVMHVLTGNYKADQVHVPAILQRLGE